MADTKQPDGAWVATDSNSLRYFAIQVHKMRLAQDRYFELASKYKNRKHPEMLKEKQDALIIAKELEKQVDKEIQDIYRDLEVISVSEPARPPITVEPLTD